MATKGKKILVLFSDEILQEIEQIRQVEGMISIQEFIRRAVYEQIKRWKSENYGGPRRLTYKDKKKEEEDEE